MRISDLTSNLQEAPLGKIGSAVAKGVGGVSKAVGGALGTVAGIPGAVGQGYKQMKQAVSGQAPDPNKLNALQSFKTGFQQQQVKMAAATQAKQGQQADPKTVTKKYDTLGAVDNTNRPNLVSADNDVQGLKQKLAAAQAEITKLRMQVNQQAAADDNPNIVRSDSSIERTGKKLSESINLFRRS